MNDAAKERQIPIGLIIAGELLFLVAGLVTLGRDVGLLLAFVGVLTVIGTLLMLLSAFLMASIFNVSFGDFKAAVLKLAGIYIFSSAIGAFMPAGFGGLISSAVFVVLMMWLFELELTYVIVFAIINWVVNLIAGIAVAGMLS